MEDNGNFLFSEGWNKESLPTHSSTLITVQLMAWKEHGGTTSHKDSAELQVEDSENNKSAILAF